MNKIKFVALFLAFATGASAITVDLTDCYVNFVQVSDICYETCGKSVTLMQRIVTCPLTEVNCENGTVTSCPPPPLPPSPLPPSPMPPPYPPSPPPPAKGGGSCSWFCNPCDNCKKNPLFPGQCIYFGGADGLPIGKCTVKEDCIFGNVIIRQGDNLNDTAVMGRFAAPPDQWTCVPNTSVNDTVGGVAVCTFGECSADSVNKK